MSAFLAQLDGLGWIFFLSAAVGGILFLVRITLQFIGGDSDSSGDVGHDFGHDLGHDISGDADSADLAHDGGSHSDAGFRLLSLQGIMGFFLVFGLTGLAFQLQTKAGAAISIVLAFFAGYAMLWVIGWMTAMMVSLQSSGNVDVQNAVGQEGTVYLRIPAEGTGQAMVSVQERMKVLDAVAEDRRPIDSGARITVVRVDGSVLVVRRIEA